jgi:redox-sensitive bicupin YhaK (pirin superfamily)
MNSIRKIKKIITGLKASDGDGVQITRYIGIAELNILDPFLLLDVFGSDKPQDYIGGFPVHPHRGFETVTYMLAGKMRHKDSTGTSGVIEAGGVQWMRAGSGIIHSEMPEQEQGLLAGFQLWINLPASHKMATPSYQEVAKNAIPNEIRADSCSLQVIAGQTQQGTQGVIQNDLTKPLYWDIHLSQDAKFIDSMPAHYNAFIYVIEGELSIADTLLSVQQLAVLGKGENICLQANKNSRFLLVAAKPLQEPVVRSGPFVMNTQAEINKAYDDYYKKRFIAE